MFNDYDCYHLTDEFTYTMKEILAEVLVGVLFQPLIVIPLRARTNDLPHVNSLYSGSLPPKLGMVDR